MPENDVGREPLFEQLMTASRAAHATGCHEAAYHALTAAMHMAHCGAELPRLHEVAREARRQIEWIDANAPEHRLSTTSAGRHDHPGVYRLLARQAEMYADMAQRAAQQRAAQQRTTAPDEQKLRSPDRPA